MDRPWLKRFLPQLTTGIGVFLLCSALAAAQTAPGAPDQNANGAQAQDNSQSSNGPRTDGQIEMDVVHALDASQALKNDLITAATIQTEVTLSGTVSSQASKDLAGKIAGGVPGVTKVHNNLTVGNPQQAADAQGVPLDQQEDQSLDQPQPPPRNQPTPGNDQANAPPEPPPAGAPAPPQGYPQQPYPQARPQYSPYPAPPPQYGQQPPYGQQPQYGQAPPYGQPPYGRAPYGQPGQPPPGYQQPQYQPATGPVTITPGTLIQVRAAEPVDSKHAVDGTPVQFTLIQDVTAGGVLAIPRGATFHGIVTHVKKVGSGQLTGSAELALTLTSLDLGGQNYPVQSDEFKVKSPGKGGRTASNAIAGGLIGTIIGCAAGRGAGCAIGAGAGVAAGTAASAASSGPNAWIPAEALVDFHLNEPLTVNPVSPQEAARLAQGLYQGGPNLYRRRGPYGYYGPAGYPAGYPMYAYPPVYYRPYYMVGGGYYWR